MRGIKATLSITQIACAQQSGGYGTAAGAIISMTKSLAQIVQCAEGAAVSGQWTLCAGQLDLLEEGLRKVQTLLVANVNKHKRPLRALSP
jgi:hypothetical protein